VIAPGTVGAAPDITGAEAHSRCCFFKGFLFLRYHALTVEMGNGTSEHGNTFYPTTNPKRLCLTD